jgi:hypothetical protein
LAARPAIAQQPLPENPPDDVSGKWIVSSKGENGEVHTQYLTIKQNGTVLTGHFKGPYQSGSINGTINVHHIVIRTNTRHPLTYRGRVDGNTISGTIHVEGREGEFNAARQSP